MDYNNLSNSELRILLNKMENEYEVLRNNIKNNLSKMNDLDDKYIKVKSVLDNRTKGKIWVKF